MTLQAFFKEHGVSSLKAVPFSAAPIIKPHLLEEITGAWVIVMTVPYYLNTTSSPLSRYAIVKDYHGFFASLFNHAQTFLSEKYPSGVHRGFSDHSPFDEVRLGALAGLGVIGDNGLLITKEYGSFVFIGELITSLSEEELVTEDIPVQKEIGVIASCSHCGRCQNACPGKCLPSLERTTCASHLSQKKGNLSPEEEIILQRSAFAWGCDHCQIVCPMNQQISQTSIPYFLEDHLGNTTVQTILNFSDETYLKYPFSWRKKEILERNVSLLEKGARHD